jgi:ABC-type sugar transport system ATPase subunit
MSVTSQIRAPLLAVEGIQKKFGGVAALRSVSLAVEYGQIHALCGENGAGKSTLMHILAGVHGPDAGCIRLEGEEVHFESEHAAQKRGIGTVYQERTVFGALSVAENIFAGRQPVTHAGRIDSRALAAQTERILADLELRIAPAALVDDLSPAERQMVEIARALSLRAKVLILDEPTSALTTAEVSALFRILRRLREHRCGIIFISHRLDEVFEIADRVSVLRDGESQGSFVIRETSPDAVIGAMVGRRIERRRAGQAAVWFDAPPVLEARKLSDRGRLKDVSFQIHRGEILGIAGLAGAGRTELAMALFGAVQGRSGEILMEGRLTRIRSPHEAMVAGIGYVTEDRRRAGLYLEMGLADNIVAADLDRCGSWWASPRKRDSVAEPHARALRIRAVGLREPIQNLSGGNQQKALLSRWLLRKPKVLIADEPTAGIDVGSKAEVHDLLMELAREGTAIMLISSELPEILALTTRVLVMREGRFSAELRTADATEEKILQYATNTVENWS